MLIEIKVPSPGESISQVQLSALLVKNGAFVEKDAEIAEIDSDKATLPIFASESGQINFLVSEGDTLLVGSVLCTIDSSVKSNNIESPKVEEVKAPAIEKPIAKETSEHKTTEHTNSELNISPLARVLLNENNLSEQEFIEKLKHIRLGKKEISEVLSSSAPKNAVPVSKKTESREVEKKKMSSLRLKLSERLLSAKNHTAMLTTFNEVNMQSLMTLRNKYKEDFKAKHGISLGYMSFFTKAVTIALQQFPIVNSQIEGDEIISFNYTDIAVAVSTPKGLMVPVVKDTNTKSIAEIEKSIFELAQKARNNRISLDELTGGTFTITNGGVFGSLLSTPILNTPQSAILGMHNIVERPIAVNGKVEVAPMMYIALSYDHRIIDGKDSVGFLIKVKELIEHPENLLLEGANTANLLLDL